LQVGQYFIEVWKAAGMDMANVQFLWSSDEIVNNAESYWTQALDIARLFTVARVKKCCTIMGRSEVRFFVLNKLTNPLSEQFDCRPNFVPDYAMHGYFFP
jgi:hypothetical protein